MTPSTIVAFSLQQKIPKELCNNRYAKASSVCSSLLLNFESEIPRFQAGVHCFRHTLGFPWGMALQTSEVSLQSDTHPTAHGEERKLLMCQSFFVTALDQVNFIQKFFHTKHTGLPGLTKVRSRARAEMREAQTHTYVPYGEPIQVSKVASSQPLRVFAP